MMNANKNLTFFTMNLSENLKNGLAEAGFKHPTQIQKECIDIALKGEDILACAKTGSGKSLAFIIPLLELLNKEKWSLVDGLGALVITPTRELAYQIYEVIKKVGKYFDFSIALVFGGKDLKFEWNRLHAINILISTPGRLLQHLDSNIYFSTDNLKILVLDEADRILDLGFEIQLNSIINHLPKSRQTLLFSATQTKNVKDLARLNLKNPIYIDINNESNNLTPQNLNQNYIICQLHEKINILWSFLKSHLHYKIIVFFSTCKQTNFIYELFKQMKLNTSFLALYGTLHQLRRMDIYDEFCRRKNAVLFSTDIASRGLDFPDINWVIQYDCPEDLNAYIHRVGRTARYKKGGESLLFISHSEKLILDELHKNDIPITEIQINPSKIRNIQIRAAALCARDLELKQKAQRCFKTYLKSIYFMKNKSIFNVKLLDLDLYAYSLGLENSPRLRFFEKNKNLNKNLNEKLKINKEKIDKIKFEDDNDIIKLKRKYTLVNDNENNEFQLSNIIKKNKNVTKEAIARKLLKKNIAVNKKKKFNDDDNLSDFEIDLNADYDVNAAKEKLKLEDIKDKIAYKNRLKEAKLKNKLKNKLEKNIFELKEMDEKLNKNRESQKNEEDFKNDELENINK